MDTEIKKALGDKAAFYLDFAAPKIAKSRLHLPGPDFVDRIFSASDRSNRVLTNLQRLFGTGRLAGTGFLSILPVDQGIEHSAGRSREPTTSTPKTSCSWPSRWLQAVA
jgi:class I fructose-bisphosphate aldolase